MTLSLRFFFFSFGFAHAGFFFFCCSFVEMYEMTLRPRLGNVGLEGVYLVWLKMMKKRERKKEY